MRPRSASGYHLAVVTANPAVTLRPIEPSDAERVAAMFTEEGYPAASSTVTARIERFEASGGRIIIADDGGEVLGFIAVHPMPRFEHDDVIVRILALVVDPGARSRGIGHLLMEEAERIGRELGAVFTEVTAGHHRPEARHLYESLGYDASVTMYLRKRI